MTLNLRLLLGLICALVLSCATSWAAVTEVTASIDKNPVMADESLVLTITANDDADSDAFDPSPLLKDFVVGRTSVSRQTQMINFDTTRTTNWTTVLIPRKEGDFTIPTFNVAGQTTQAISLKVVPVSASDASQSRDIYITTKVDSNQVYLQQQLRYTIKLHLAQDLQRGSLQAPVLENADIRQLGKDAEYSEIINGRRYRIIERHFAIIPQQSGHFSINGPLFEGEVLASSNQRFGFFNRTRSINRIGPAIDIEVLPIPASVTDHWLPSEYVQLSEEWQNEEQGYQVGEPITRTLTLSAIGLVEEQLPEVPKHYPPSIKTYPDQAKTTTVEKDQVLIAQRVENIALIPSRPGNFVIPSVSVPWFNTKTGKTELATLPARTIAVTAAPASSQSALPATNDISSAPLPVAQSVPTLAAPSPVKQAAWWSISSWLLLAAWLITLLLWWTTTNNRKKILAAPVKPNIHQEQAWQQLLQGIKRSDPGAVIQPLSTWLALYCKMPDQPLPASQRQLANQALDKAIDQLFASQFSLSPESWNSAKLKAVLQQLKSDSSHNGKHQKLAALYPQLN